MGAITLSAPEFVARWRGVRQTERAVAHQHFLDLCALFQHPTPNEVDPTGDSFAFEKRAVTPDGKLGFADVWKRDYFTWEYKQPGKSLDQAYRQMLNYRDSLYNPPLLVACDIEHFEIHTNFTGSKPTLHRLTNDDLLDPEALRLLRAAFEKPALLHPARPRVNVTEEAARRFGDLAREIERRKIEPGRAAHFLTQILFCLFAEDLGLLISHRGDRKIFSDLLRAGEIEPEVFLPNIANLFRAMRAGGIHYIYKIPHFNGGLFDVIDPVELRATEIAELVKLADYDWSTINTTVMGTLFERSFDPEQRAQLGAHYTGRADIERIVEPVVVAPLRREWAALRVQLDTLIQRRDGTIPETEARRRERRNERSQQNTLLAGMLLQFKERLSQVRILDPAAGSGNFLTVALSELLDLEKEVIVYGALAGLSYMLPEVSPRQLYGLEINAYAHELSQVAVWITYLQWLHANGFRQDRRPLLQSLDTIRLQDALLEIYDPMNPRDSAWPDADFIIGNPPFLGGKRLRAGLGDEYVDLLYRVYAGRVSREADLVVYWHEKARAQIAAGKAKRAGLIATQSIRAGANRQILERAKQSGDLFLAWSDEPWVLEGAAVRISVVGYDDGSEQHRMLDGKAVPAINADLTASLDVTVARPLVENSGIAFQGPVKVGAFEIPPDLATHFLNQPVNPNGMPNSDVIRPWINGMDLTRRPRGYYIIDFGIRDEQAASLYEAPFEYVRRHVKPFRDENRDTQRRTHWWRLGRSGEDLRQATADLDRIIVTPRVARHRLFIWASSDTLPDSRVYAITRDDDYFFGVLHSRVHEIWSLRFAPRHGVGNDPTYNSGTSFVTFPFPWLPGYEPQNDPQLLSIADAAQRMVALRDLWLNPPGASEDMLRTRTLTNLYNERPAWLDIAHRTLDHMVFDAYGWPHDLSDEELLARLLALNLERARRPLLRRVNLDKTASGPARNPIGAQQPVIPGLGPYDMGAQSAVPAPSNQIDSQDQKRRA